MDIVSPDPGRPIVNQQGFMEDPFRIFTLLISKLSILEGTGSPEGVVEAETTRLYMDSAGSSGSILYIKKLADIAGDKTKGWEAV